MPSGNRKPLTVHEPTWRAVKSIVNSEKTPYDTYDDFIRDAVESADDHFEVLSDEEREAVSGD